MRPRSSSRGAELVLRHARELDVPRRVEGRGGGALGHLPVPAPQQPQCFAGRLVFRLRPREQSRELARLQGHDVPLDGAQVLGRHPRLREEQLRDARRAIRRRPRETEGVRVARRRAVVRGDEKPARRIEHARQVVERNGPLPVVVAGTGDRQAAVGAGPHGHRARRRVTDVAVPVGVEEVLRRRVHERDAGEELVPARRPVDRDRRPPPCGRPGRGPSSAARPRGRARERPPAPLPRWGRGRTRGRSRRPRRLPARGCARRGWRTASTRRGGDSGRDAPDRSARRRGPGRPARGTSRPTRCARCGR